MGTSKALRSSKYWTKGWSDFHSGVDAEGNPFKWSGGNKGAGMRAMWDSGWNAAKKGEPRNG